MKPTIKVVRAIGAEFVWRTVRPWLFIGAGVAVVLSVLGAWLVTVSAWWWLFLAPVLLLVVVFTVLSLIFVLLVRMVDSVQSKEQKLAVAAYVDAMERVTENVRTPWPVLLMQVARDVVWPSRDGFVATVSRDSVTLAPGFAALLRLFG